MTKYFGFFSKKNHYNLTSKFGVGFVLINCVNLIQTFEKKRINNFLCINYKWKLELGFLTRHDGIWVVIVIV